MFFALFISLFFLVGFGLLGWGLYSMYRGQQARSWPRVPGSIVDCQIKQNSDGEGGTTWHVEVRYKYQVAGKDFESDRVAFGYVGSSSYDEHRAIHEKLMQAKQVEVKHDPDDSAIAVLAAGVNRSTILILVFALTWLLFTTGFTVLWYYSQGRDNRILEQIRVLK